jgi:hypothetical protein
VGSLSLLWERVRSKIPPEAGERVKCRASQAEACGYNPAAYWTCKMEDMKRCGRLWVP